MEVQYKNKSGIVMQRRKFLTKKEEELERAKIDD
jgi:hypothetical protein